ncbi:hypothetical protein C5G87_25985 [Paenibacillus peoriae]|nr:hypothetical protein C5G87_25985 [Paenibacillus peoriae]
MSFSFDKNFSHLTVLNVSSAPPFIPTKKSFSKQTFLKLPPSTPAKLDALIESIAMLNDTGEGLPIDNNGQVTFHKLKAYPGNFKYRDFPIIFIILLFSCFPSSLTLIILYLANTIAHVYKK